MQQIYNILLSFFRLKDIEKRFNNHKCLKENSVSASNKEGHGASSKDFVAHFPPPLGTQGLDDQKQCIINDPQAIDQNDQRNGPILGKETLISNQSNCYKYVVQFFFLLQLCNRLTLRGLKTESFKLLQ